MFDPSIAKIPWRRKWLPTLVFLPGESHGQRSLTGYSPQGRKESDTTERLLLLLSIIQGIIVYIKLKKIIHCMYQYCCTYQKNSEQSKRRLDQHAKLHQVEKRDYALKCILHSNWPTGIRGRQYRSKGNEGKSIFSKLGSKKKNPQI